MDKIRSHTIFITLLVLSISGVVLFIINTGLYDNKLLFILLAALLAFPLREHKLLAPYYTTICVVFVCFLVIAMGSTVLPFIFAFIIGYLFDPVLSKLERTIRCPRWLSALVLIILAGGVLVTISVFVFPLLIEQADAISKQISSYVNDLKKISSSRKTYTFLRQFGIERNAIREAFDKDIMPQLQTVAKVLFTQILHLLTSVGNVATQIVNLIIFPFLTFYFLKDFTKIRNKANELLTRTFPLSVKYAGRLDSVLRIYFGWQIIAACIVASVASIVYSAFNIPYGILIACIAGVLNPIPFLGTIISILIGTLIVLLTGDGNILHNILIIAATLGGIHFINAFVIEPNIAGSKVGLHPIIMILSVFVFNSIFGIVGMLVAVPITAVIATIIKDLMAIYEEKKMTLE
ncbi:MAG: AI-2E family transporter [Ignavibacteria bacterium]|jgi:predicted PurR-regulated permease PerM|nr:AI-2E family transporter [Ignavibacteria bacterium]